MQTRGGRAVGEDTSVEYVFEVALVAGYIPPAFRFRPAPPIVLLEGLGRFTKVSRATKVGRV